jgi:carboxymethylenebutenolidase
VTLHAGQLRPGPRPAARYKVDAAVAYHGGDTEKYLGEVGGLDAPLLMHLGEEDEFISKAAQAEIKAALAKRPNATICSYPGQRHAFSRHDGLHYNAAAAALANGRTNEFLKDAGPDPGLPAVLDRLRRVGHA